MENIIDEYIKYVQKFLYDYYRILMSQSYEKKLVYPFIQRYIDARYYNDFLSSKKSSKFVGKISNELKLVFDNVSKEYEGKTDKIKNIFALFSYILYLDDCIPCSNVNKLITTLLNDENIHIDISKEEKDVFTEMVRCFVNNKKKFFELFDVKEFELKYLRLRKNLYSVDILQHCKISPIYSEYAIEKAYSSSVVVENKVYLMYYLVCAELLHNVIELNYDKTYVVDYPVSLCGKSKKSNRYLRLLDNNISKQRISLRFYYKDYLSNKECIENLIKDGYSVSLILDDSFDDNYSILILFSYVFVYEKYEYYDYIYENKDKLNCIVVTL